MTEDTRQNLAQVLLQVAACFPEWRYGQMVENLAAMAGVSLYDLEDDQMLVVARKFLHTHHERLAETASRP